MEKEGGKDRKVEGWMEGGNRKRERESKREGGADGEMGGGRTQLDRKSGV